MRAVRLEADGVPFLLLPARELIAHEADLLPQVADHAGRAVRGELDDRRDDLDHAAVEVDGAAGRDLGRRFLTLQQRRVDERLRMLPVRLGIDLHLVEPDVELRLHPHDRHCQPGPLGEPAVSDLFFPIRSRHEVNPGRGGLLPR